MHNLRLLILGLSFFTTSLQAASVTLAWSASPDTSVIGYRLYVGTVSNSFTFSTNDTGNALTVTLTNLSYGVTYWFAATAYNVDVESEFSNQISYRPPFPKPAAPSLLRRVTAAVKEWFNDHRVFALAKSVPVGDGRKQVEHVTSVPVAYIFIADGVQGARN